MIGKLKGIVDSVDGNEALVETAGGVYYRVFLTPTLLSKSRPGEKIELTTYLHVKDDGLTLFGFEDSDKYKLFQMLLSVDGVGPKLAFVVISYTSGSDIMAAVTSQNHAFFSSIPGIGKKTAHKILLELSSRLKTEFAPLSLVMSQDEVTILEAVSALGFDKKEAQKHLGELEAQITIEEKITQIIRLMSKK